MPALVTGAAGFVGMHVADALLHRGLEVAGVDNLNDYYDPQLKQARLQKLSEHPAFQFHRVDISDPCATKDAFNQLHPEIVVHLAAQVGVRNSLSNPLAYGASNFTGFLNILEACRYNGVRHLVYASSSSVYGLSMKMPFSVEQSVDHPISLYAATKKANELMAHSYSHLFGLPTTGLRFFTVYGPWGRPDMAYFKFTKAIIEGRPIDIYNQGRMKRDFTYIDDIVEGVLRVAERPTSPDTNWSAEEPSLASSCAPYRVYNIGNNRPVELNAFIEIIEHAVGRQAKKRFLPMQPGDMLETAADITPLERDFGFRPVTTLEEGVPRFVEWYRSFYGVCQ